MTHPAIDQGAVDRLRRRAGAPEPTSDPMSPAPGGGPGAGAPATTVARVKAKARQVATPVVARVRTELDRAASGEVESLRAEVAELRTEMARLRAEHAAAIAALQEDHRA